MYMLFSFVNTYLYKITSGCCQRQISNEKLSIWTQIEFDLILLSQSGFDEVDKGSIYSRI